MTRSKTTEIYLAYVGDARAKLDHDWPHPIPLPDMTYNEAMALPDRGHNKGHSGGGSSAGAPTSSAGRKQKKSMSIK